MSPLGTGSPTPLQLPPLLELPPVGKDILEVPVQTLAGGG